MNIVETQEIISRHDVIAELGVLVILPPMLIIPLWLGSSWTLGRLTEGSTFDLLVIWTSLVGALVILPLLYLKHSASLTSWRNLGVCGPSHRSLFVLVGLFVATVTVTLMLHGPRLGGLIMAQYVAVSVCEEFWSKAVVFRTLSRVIRSRAVVLTLTAAIFAFYLHLSESFLTNLVIRFPLGLLTAIVFSRSRSLAWPILIHWTYDVIIS